MSHEICMRDHLLKGMSLALMSSILAGSASGQSTKIPPPKANSENHSTKPVRATTGSTSTTAKLQILAAVNNTRTEKEALARLVKELPPEQRAGLVAELVKMLQSQYWEVRVNAAYVLGEFGPIATPAAQAMIDSMNSMEMENVAWEVVPALAKIGPGAVPPLREALRKRPTKNLEIYHLIEAAGALGPQAQELTPQIVPFLRDGDNSGAVKALVKIGSGSIPAICNSLSTERDDFIPLYAAKVLSTFKGSAPTLALLAQLKHTSAQGREKICHVFANLKPAPDKQATTTLCNLLKANDTNIRTDIIAAIKNNGPSAVPDVAELLSDKTPPVYTAATEILEHFGPKAFAALPALTKMMRSSDLEISMTAASTMLKIDSNNKLARERLQSYLNSKDELTRAAAARHLAESGSGASLAVPALIKKLTDNDSQVREESATALGNIGPAADSALPELLTAATSSHPPISNAFERIGKDSDVQRAAVIAIGKITAKPPATNTSTTGAPTANTSTAVAVLIRILKDPSKSFLHQYVLEAFTQMRGSASPAVPTLIDMLKTPGNKHTAIGVLKEIGPAAKQALPELQRMYDDKSVMTRKEAFSAILAIENNQTRLTENAEQMLRDRDYEVKEAAIKTLTRYPSSNTETIKLLIAALKGSQQNIRMSSIEAVGACGPEATDALEYLINENIGCSYSPPQKSLSFAAIKKIDPSGEKTITIVQPALNDSFKVRGATELLEFIGSPKSSALGKATRDRWKLK